MTYMAACHGKQKFDSPQLARKAAARVKGRTAYRCRFCGFWHTGKTHERSKQEIRSSIRDRGRPG
jgi:rubrerythrin